MPYLVCNMANRRMFSNRIANSAKFLQMPIEAQLLYFHMILRADDDGVVEAYPLMKLLGSAPDVFKVLLLKGYVKQLNEDQVIVIMDWLEHNVIRADRKVDSIYKHLLLSVPDVVIIEAKPRSDVEDNSKRLGGQSTDGISQVKLGKVNTIATEVASEFSLKEEIKKLMESERRELRIIGWFIHEKKVSLKNKEQLSTTIKRHLRPAKLLISFDVPQLKSAADNADRQIGNKWTLETLYKLLTK